MRQPDAKLPSSLKPYDMRRDSDIYYNFYQYLGYSKKHLQQYLSTQGSATTLKRLPNVENTEQARQVLEEKAFTVSSRTNNQIEVKPVPENPAVITQILADAGIYLTGLRTEEGNLEEVFLGLTEGRSGDML